LTVAQPPRTIAASTHTLGVMKPGSAKTQNTSVDVDPQVLRQRFVVGLAFGLRVVWPILSVLLGLILALGLVVGVREGWSVQESIYFSFVSGLTIGYGDFAPKTLLTRALAVVIGMCGVLLTALLAAIAVKALTVARGGSDE
jgi:Ion channel